MNRNAAHGSCLKQHGSTIRQDTDTGCQRECVCVAAGGGPTHGMPPADFFLCIPNI